MQQQRPFSGSNPNFRDRDPMHRPVTVTGPMGVGGGFMESPFEVRHLTGRGASRVMQPTWNFPDSAGDSPALGRRVLVPPSPGGRGQRSPAGGAMSHSMSDGELPRLVDGRKVNTMPAGGFGGSVLHPDSTVRGVMTVHPQHGSGMMKGSMLTGSGARVRGFSPPHGMQSEGEKRAVWRGGLGASRVRLGEMPMDSYGPDYGDLRDFHVVSGKSPGPQRVPEPSPSPSPSPTSQLASAEPASDGPEKADAAEVAEVLA